MSIWKNDDWYEPVSMVIDDDGFLLISAAHRDWRLLIFVIRAQWMVNIIRAQWMVNIIRAQWMVNLIRAQWMVNIIVVI